jgi:hypothetical protein
VRRELVVFSALAGSLAVGLILFLWLGQRHLLYLPSSGLLAPDIVGLANLRVLDIRTQDGLTLGAWYVPPRQAALPAATVIVFNGNAGNRSHRAPLAWQLAEAGYATVLVDYRGYGGNPGTPSERGLLADARAVVATLRADAEAGRARLVYFGESLGSGVAVQLAVELPPAALVLRSPFTSITDVAAHHYWFLPVRRLLWDRFDSLSRIAHVGCPLLVVAGDRDRVVPFALSQRLFEAARQPKRFVRVPGADHNDAELTAGAPLRQAMLPWLQQVLEQDSASRAR